MRVSTIKQVFLFLVLITTMVMYVPAVYNTSLYDVLRYVVYGLMGGLVLMTFSWTAVTGTRITRIILWLVIIIVVEFAVFTAFQLNRVMGDLVQLIIVFFMLIAGMKSSMEETALIRLCAIYCIGTVTLGVLSVISYLGAFSLATNAYAIAGKNQVGEMVSFGAAVSFYISQTRIKRARFFLFISLIGMALSVLIRCRTATVALLLLVLCVVSRGWQLKWKISFAFICVILYIVLFNTVNDFVADIFLRSGDIEVDLNQGDLMNQISTSRFERNAMAIVFLRDHLLTGELTELSNIPLIHNYLLLRLVRYGFFSLPFIVFYFCFLIKSVKVLINGKIDLNNMGWIVLIFPLFCSLLEPSAPFGPGTVQLMPYLLCGIAIRRSGNV